MEIKQYAILIWRWAWLVVLGLGLGVGAGYGFSRSMTPVYQTSSKILVVGRSPLDKTNTMLYASDVQLVQTYIELLKTQPIIDDTKAILGYNVSATSINVQQVLNTQVIKITVDNSNPQRVAEIANTLVDALVATNNKRQMDKFTAAQDSLKKQMEETQKNITDLQAQLTQMYNDENNKQIALVDEKIQPLAVEMKTLNAEISALEAEAATLGVVLSVEQRAQLIEKQARLSQIQSDYAVYQKILLNLTFLGKPSEASSGIQDPRQLEIQSLLVSYQKDYQDITSSMDAVNLARQQYTSNIMFIERAPVPKVPIQPTPTLYSLLAGAAGAILAVVAVIGIEYFNDTLKDAAQIQNVLELAVVGQIPHLQTGSLADGLHAKKAHFLGASESFDALRVNLEFMGRDKPFKTILVIDAGRGEERTSVAVNLAISLAQSGKKVALVDANLRQPRLHDYLGLENHGGLSDVLTPIVDYFTSLQRELDRGDLTDVLTGNLDIQAASAYPEQLKDITLITSGSPCPNPLELLESAKMSQLLLTLQKKVDVVVLVGPPAFAADTLVVASKVDGVLQVIRARHVGADEARINLEQLNSVHARVIGAVMVVVETQWRLSMPGKKLKTGTQVSRKIAQSNFIRKK